MDTIENELVKKFGPIIKRQSSTQVYFICPDCSSSKLSANLEKGIVHCWKCGYKLGKRLVGIPSFKPTKINKTLQLKIIKFLSDNLELEDLHREYLKERGVFNPQEYKIGSIPFNILDILGREFSEKELVSSGLGYRYSGAFRLSLTLEPRRIFIPYWHLDEIVGCKTRENPYLYSELDIKYLIPKGCSIGQNLFQKKPTTNSDLLITEGELKCIAALENHYDCVAVPGINYSLKVTQQIRKLAGTKTIRRIFVVFDNDRNFMQKQEVISSICKTCSIIGQKAAPVILPKLSATEKQDLDSFFKAHNSKDFDEILEDSWFLRKQNLQVLMLAQGLKKIG
jgi:ribosomal protein L37AE/L43A